VPTVLAFVSPKGGAGKTAVTAGFGRLLAEVGFRVLLVDTDGATNGLSLFYIDHLNERRDAVEAEGEMAVGTFDSSGYPCVCLLAPNLDLLPATYYFRGTESMSAADFENRLHNIIDEFDEYDFILLDAQAGADAYAQVTMKRSVSSTVVIVSEFDPVSAAGVERLKALQREELAYERTWVLINKILPEFISEFASLLGIAHYASPLPWDADVVRAFARRELALDFDAGNGYTTALIQTAESVLGRTIGRRLADWKADKAAKVRKPLEEQISEAKKNLDLIREMQEEITSSVFRRRVLSSVTIPLLATVAAALLSPLVYSYRNLTITMIVPGLAIMVASVVILETVLRERRSISKSRDNSELKEKELEALEQLQKLSAVQAAAQQRWGN